MRRATNIFNTFRECVNHFYPRSPCGERLARLIVNADFDKFLSTLSLRRATGLDYVPYNNYVAFLSTLSLRRATAKRWKPALNSLYFYPRSPCGERLASPNSPLYPVEISIHALLAESDRPIYRWYRVSLAFLSTLSLRRATSDVVHNGNFQAPFLSTLSLRRATVLNMVFISSENYFYPRSPCGERHLVRLAVIENQLISIHALLAESDQKIVRME